MLKCGVKEAPYLHGGNILEGLDEVLLIHSSSNRSIPPCRRQHRDKMRGKVHVNFKYMTFFHSGVQNVMCAVLTLRSVQNMSVFVSSDLQTWRWRRRQDVGMNPCSPSSSRTARLLWMRTRSGRRPPSHRPRSSCLEEEEQEGEATEQREQRKRAGGL